MTNVSAFIVAAGRGSRLRPYTDEMPKCLVSFSGRRLVDWQLDALRHSGITSIGIIRGYRKEQLGQLGLPVWDNERWNDTNMVSSLLCARAALLEAESIVVAYGDIIYEPRLVAALLTAPGDIAITVDKNWHALWSLRFANPLDDAESLKIGQDGRILDIGRKVRSTGEIEAQYMGLLKFTPAGIRKFIDCCDRHSAPGAAPPVEKLAMTDVLQALIKGGDAIQSATVHAGWLEFDGVHDLNTFSRMQKSGELAPLFSTEAFGSQWSSG